MGYVDYFYDSLDYFYDSLGYFYGDFVSFLRLDICKSLHLCFI